MSNKTCQHCGFWGTPKIPPIDLIEVFLWLAFLPLGFFFSIFRRMDRNMNTCPKCKRQMVRR